MEACAANPKQGKNIRHAYDAVGHFRTILELASQLGCPLATRDKALRVAANKAGLRY